MSTQGVNRKTVHARDACAIRIRKGDDPALFRRDIGEIKNVPLLPIESCEDRDHILCLRSVVERSGVHKLVATKRERKHPEYHSPYHSMRRGKIDFRKTAKRFASLGQQPPPHTGAIILGCSTIKVVNGKGGHRGVMVVVLGAYTAGNPPKIVGYFFSLKALVEKVGLGVHDPD